LLIWSLTNCEIHSILRNIVIIRLAANGGFIACNLGTREIAFLRIYRDLQRGDALFIARPSCQNTAISAAKAMSSADNFLQKQQKQQKQRGRRVKKGRRGNPLRGPRRSRNSWTRAAGLAHFAPESS